ncbi:MAG TPA: DUF1801 domain-containing protein [Tepidiformaceae bacterium]
MAEAGTPMTVDEFVATKVLPQFRDVVEMVRQLMRECAPETQELISYGIPAWRGRKILAVVNPTKNDITFSFSRGSQFEDRYGLLRGVGKSSKHVKIRDVQTANREALRFYIAQALEMDAK